jgi:triacylglycerol lipase
MEKPQFSPHPPAVLRYGSRILSSLIVAAAAVCYIPLQSGQLPVACLWVLIPLFLLANALPYLLHTRIPKPGGAVPLLSFSHTRHSLRSCAHGMEMLRIFLISTALTLLCHLIRLPLLWTGHWKEWLISAGVAVLAEAVVFWNGMVCLYVYSVQLGIKWRVIGALCGMIPVAQLVALHRILKTVEAEVEQECAHILRNNSRSEERVCATKYPLLMVHGAFFRDIKLLNYWGRIPVDLAANGATVYYGNHQSAAAIRHSAKELAERIREIVAETGCEKVNIIAHSKGGLDIRAALAYEGIAPMVASVTTVNSPHRGCHFADFLLNQADQALRDKVAAAYNTAARVLGDTEPDFIAAVSDLTASACRVFNRELEGEAGHTEGILCRSIGSKMERALGGQFPLNFSYLIARPFDGPNDGLVSETSAAWGESYTFLTATGKRGISHGDVIDLNRINIEGFDVREFYVELVHDLKQRGL